MAGERTTRRVYSAEELHRLRASCSQLRLREAIEEHDDEDAELVKEHVLRGSKSFAARSFKSRTSGNSLRVPSNKENRSTADAENSRASSGLHVPIGLPVLGEIAANCQVLRSGVFKTGTSPTPSLKKKKAEAIVKAHGSPQHVRVTAGGRIVPSEQSPLCQPRYGWSAIKTNGGLIKFAPNNPMGKGDQWTAVTQEGFIAQDINGRLCQIVNGTILPLHEIDGVVRLHIDAPNLNISSRGSSFGPAVQGAANDFSSQRRATSFSKPITADPPISTQSNALELEYAKFEHELSELNKTDVLHARTMGKTAKEALVSKRVELVNKLDEIRKAIKAVRNKPPADAPTSPRAMKNVESTSPTRTRLPPFLQQRMQQVNESALPPIPPAYRMYFSPPYPGQYGFQPTPSPDAMFMTQPFGIPQPPVFVPPPPFDGSMSQHFAPYPDPLTGKYVGAHLQPPMPALSSVAAQVDTPLPQNDGARSFADLQRVESPARSHAVNIKAPESKPAFVLKSNLNPMSPAYKPVAGVLQESGVVDIPSARSIKDRAPTPLSPMHARKPAAAMSSTTSTTDDTPSPTKKSPHLHSSSVASFETADFFPRNTREYSTRKYAYPEGESAEDNKENVSPPPATGQLNGSPPHSAGPCRAEISEKTSRDNSSPAALYNAPVAPPGTPVTRYTSVSKPDPGIRIDSTSEGHTSYGIDFGSVPDRRAHNLSPKHKRQEYLFVYEDPSQVAMPPSSSPEKFETCRETTLSPRADVEFPDATKEWVEGYRAGLSRKPIEPDRAGDFLGGYCAGLLKSKPSKYSSSTGSPMKSASRRPSPALVSSRSATRLQNTDNRDHAPVRPPFETELESMDTLKEAVFAPQNENAILTPAADGPHINETSFNLGSWAKSHEMANFTESQMSHGGDGLAGFPFPRRTASMLKRQGVTSDNNKADFYPQTSTRDMSSVSAVPELSRSIQSAATSTRSIYPADINNTGNRISSVPSIDSHLYRPWPGNRAFSSSFEWKSAGSVAQVSSLASGYFANAQFDGAPQSQRTASVTSDEPMSNHSRFKEGSLDGVTNPPNSPHFAPPPMSPALTPTDSPSKDKKKSSPSKGNSPAKAKFEHIAEKVGIKVAGGGKKKDDGSPGSPPGKRGAWRDVWRNARKENSKDDTKFAPYAL